MLVVTLVRRTLLCGALSLCLSCENSVEQQLQGHWIGKELESTAREVSAEKEGWARGTALHFAGSHLTITVPGQAQQPSSFQVVKNIDGNLQLELVNAKGHRQTTQLTLETKTLLRWHINQQTTVVLQRR